MSNFSELNCPNVVLHGEDKVSIMFCDIADFDHIIKTQEQEVIFILDKIFRQFDELCLTYGVQKIETVGKTYMAASGLGVVEQGLPASLKFSSPTVRLLAMAKQMKKVMENYDGLDLKIGIHVGVPVMGVIGYHKP